MSQNEHAGPASHQLQKLQSANYAPATSPAISSLSIFINLALFFIFSGSGGSRSSSILASVLTSVLTVTAIAPSSPSSSSSSSSYVHHAAPHMLPARLALALSDVDPIIRGLFAAWWSHLLLITSTIPPSLCAQNSALFPP